MELTAFARLLSGIRNRRALLSGSLAALGLAVFAVDEQGANARNLTNRQRHRRRRNRRQRRRGGRRGDPSLGDFLCDVCATPFENRDCFYASIQDAIADAGFGIGITVCPGTFKENLVFKSVPVQIVAPGGAEATIIDGGGDGPAVTIPQGASVDMWGFTVTGGKNTAGGGIVNQGVLTLHDCVITENESEGAPGGGGIYNDAVHANDGGYLELENTTVSDNDADDGQGGGIFNGPGGVVVVDSQSSIVDNKPNNCVGTSACGA